MTAIRTFTPGFPSFCPTSVGSAVTFPISVVWMSRLLLEQQNGGAIAWGFGEIPTLIVLLAIATQWYRSEDRKARRADRTAARTGDPELSSYNDYLARLNELDKRE